MKRLNAPNYTAIQLFDESVDGIGDPALKQHYANNRDGVIAANVAFDQANLTKTLCNLPRAAFGNKDAIIIGDLTKQQLKDLYEVHVVRSKEKARDIYDEILVKAHGKCPYCAGIGEPKTLDHYLPKAYFPSYSVLPVNLVPACRDCNTGMSSGFPTAPELQIIHPYLDDLHFFDEKWVTANVVRTDPIVVTFDVSIPAHWNNKDKSRAAQHFEDCDLGVRYSLQVSDELAPLISQRRNYLRNLTADQFRNHLLDVANHTALPVNGWKRTLYSGLADTDWFCSADFTAPNGHMP